MKCRLSIFSFSTLRGSWRPGRAVWLAAGLVLAAEGGARWAWQKGHLMPPTTLGQLVRGQLEKLRKQPARIWILGNSTLDYGLDAGLLGERLGEPVAKLPMGSATVSGLAAMLDFYLRSTSYVPRHVVVCATKDDFNANGERARYSRRLLEYGGVLAAGLFGREPQLSRSRNEILALAFPAWRPPAKRTGSASEKDWVFSGKLNKRAEDWLVQLAFDYRLDLEGLDRLARTAARRGIRVSLVLMPATDVYVATHDRLHPELPWAAVSKAVGARCRARGIDFWDFHGPFTCYERFRDAYHLRRASAGQFTEVLAERMGAP